MITKLLIAILIIAAIGIVGCGGGSPDATQAPTQVVTGPIGTVFAIQGEAVGPLIVELAMPSDVSEPPAVIIANSDRGRRDWAGLASRFVEAGYAVLFIDVRVGVEMNWMCALSGGRCDQAVDDLLRDVKTGIDFLKDRDDVDGDRLAMIGARAAGYVAVAATGVLDGLQTAVSISPSDLGPLESVLSIGDDLLANQPRAVFFVVEEGEEVTAARLASRTSGPKMVQAYVTDSSGSLIDGLDAADDILNWMADNL